MFYIISYLYIRKTSLPFVLEGGHFAPTEWVVLGWISSHFIFQTPTEISVKGGS
jgi:hypothetical protein